MSEAFKACIGFVFQVLTFQFGWRPVAAVALQVALQALISSYLLPGTSYVTIGAVTLCHFVGAFFVLLGAIGIGWDDKGTKGLPQEEKERRYYRLVAIVGYVYSVFIGLPLIGIVMLITKHNVTASAGSVWLGYLLSVFAGSLVNVLGVVHPLKMADRKRRAEAAQVQK